MAGKSEIVKATAIYMAMPRKGGMFQQPRPIWQERGEFQEPRLMWRKEWEGFLKPYPIPTRIPFTRGSTPPLFVTFASADKAGNRPSKRRKMRTCSHILPSFLKHSPFLHPASIRKYKKYNSPHKQRHSFGTPRDSPGEKALSVHLCVSEVVMSRVCEELKFECEF